MHNVNKVTVIQTALLLTKLDALKGFHMGKNI